MNDILTLIIGLAIGGIICFVLTVIEYDTDRDMFKRRRLPLSVIIACGAMILYWVIMIG